MTDHNIHHTLHAPRIVLDAAQVESLLALASIAMARSPEVAESLYQEIERADVVPAGSLPADVVAIGSIVTYRDEIAGRDHTIRLVHPHDADIDQGRISVLTPLGAALIGLAVGASMGWLTRTGAERRLTVLAVGTDNANAA